MDYWNECAYPAIAAMAKQDDVYLALLTENKMLEQEYMKIVEALGIHEQETVERYIASCEDMEFRFAQLAYRFGVLQNN